ncbi:MAG: murein hydrolase activator EnvC family protein [Hydrogenobacter sp.]
MKAILLSFIIFLSGCGLVKIELRDITPKEKAQQKKEPKRKEEPEFTAPILVPMPVRGTPVKLQKGYFIKTSCDEFFRSVDNGKVIYAGDDIKSYRWLLMVDTGRYIAVYGKAQKLFVRKGESVKRWQPLGKVGQHGDACGITFEIRNNEGEPVSFEFER